MQIVSEGFAPSFRATRRNFQCLPNIAAPQSKRVIRLACGSEHLPDGGFAVGTDDGGLDALALQVDQHGRDAREQRYLACGGELALSHVADDGRQLPHRYVEARHDFARGQAAQPFHLVVADGRKIEPRDHVLEGGAKPRKGIRQRAVEVENGEAIVGHEIRPSAGHLSSPLKYAGLPVVQVSPQSWLPPSTVSVSPVTNFADGPARKTLASATSQGEPVRIIGFERG